MKRLFSRVSNFTRSKRPRLHPPLAAKPRLRKKMVSASHTHNCLINDCLIDWLKSRSRRGTRSTPVYTRNLGFQEFILQRGVDFEAKLIEYIDREKIPVVSVSNFITDETCRKATALMRSGVPVLHSVPVRNNYNRTQGIIDLLVRSDCLSQIINVNPLTLLEQRTKAPKLDGDYHYIVIDIKFSTLPLCADGIHLLNSGHYPAYKAQLLIYTQAIGRIQGYTCPYAFILGRRWRYRSKNIVERGFSCLERLGKIDYLIKDQGYAQRTKNALKWIRDVRNNGQKWSTAPPSRKELYPNMCRDSGKWNGEKRKIASRIGEITSIWHVGVKHRDFALRSGIVSWRDPSCSAATLNIKGKRAPIIDKILEINRQTQDLIRPIVVKNNLYNWKEVKNELFVDFETLSDIFSGFEQLPKQENSSIIFMIGVGWEEDGDWRYQRFICKSPTPEEEYDIMNEFVNFVTAKGNPRLNYWHAEKSFWTRAENRQFDLACRDRDIERKDHISDDWQAFNWCDMYNIFKQEPIVIKGCFKFGLKEIAKAMRKHKMIEIGIESDCDSGMMAMVRAWECYQTRSCPVNTTIMQDITKYNEFDCRVLWEILTYLREHHC